MKNPPRVLECAEQILRSGESITKKSVIEESSRRCADTRKSESTAKKKALSKSPTRVLEALSRYSEAGKVPLKKASSKSPARVLEALRRYSEAGKYR